MPNDPILGKEPRIDKPIQARRTMWNPRQVAAYLGIDTRMVTYLAVRGDLPRRKIGSQWRFYQDELENLPSTPKKAK